MVWKGTLSSIKLSAVLISSTRFAQDCAVIVLPQRGEELRGSPIPLSIHRQLIVNAGRSDVSFSSETTGKMGIFLKANCFPYYC